MDLSRRMNTLKIRYLMLSGSSISSVLVLILVNFNMLVSCIVQHLSRSMFP